MPSQMSCCYNDPRQPSETLLQTLRADAENVIVAEAKEGTFAESAGDAPLTSTETAEPETGRGDDTVADDDKGRPKQEACALGQIEVALETAIDAAADTAVDAVAGTFEGVASRMMGIEEQGPTTDIIATTPVRTSVTKKRRRSSRCSRQEVDKDLDQMDLNQIDLRERCRKAKRSQMKHACTTVKQGLSEVAGSSGENHEFYFKSLRTSPHELGAYGVGIQLYYEFLWGLGLVFLFLSLLMIPKMGYCASGTMINFFPETEESPFLNKAFALLSIANLGSCESKSEGCHDAKDFQNRTITSSSDSSLLKDVTPTLGVIDLLATLVLLSFIVFFRRVWIPRTVRLQDEAHVTAADFSVEVSGLPRKLDGAEHHNYEELLREHFVEILVSNGIKKEDALIPEISLIREYDGAIHDYMRQGKLLQNYREEKLARRLAEKNQKKKLEKKHQKAEAKLLRALKKMEEKLQPQDAIKVEDREVCGAFLMFNQEALKNTVLGAYRNSTYAWIYQDRKLKFRNHGIFVHQAVEPTEIFWENLDFSWFQHKARKLCTILLAVLLIMVAAGCLNLFKAADAIANTDPQPAEMWVFKGGEMIDKSRSCFDLCELQLFSDMNCEGTPLRVKTIFDDQGKAWNHSEDEQENYTLIDNDFKCRSPTRLWNSPGCKKTGAKDSWVALELETKSAVQCVNGSSKTRIPLAMYGCNNYKYNVSKHVFSSSVESGWTPEEQCVRYRDVVIDPSIQKQHIAMQRDCLHAVTVEAAEHALALDNEDPVEGPRVKCFCLQETERNPSLRFDFESREGKLCEHWTKREHEKTFGRVMGVLAIIILNQAILFVFSVLDVWTRYRTHTDLAQSQMISLFLAQFVNTGVIHLLIGMQLHGSYGGELFRAFAIGEGQFDDMQSGWFTTIGSTIVTTIISQAASAITAPLVMTRVVQPLKIRFLSMGKVTQEVLDELHLFGEWKLSLRLAQGLVCICCVIIYANGFPFLYVFGALYCFLAYWADKYVLLRGSRVPPAYTKSAIRPGLGLIPLAVLAGLVFSLWLHGQPELYPSDWSDMRGFAEAVLEIDQKRCAEVKELFQDLSTSNQQRWYREYLKCRMLDAAREGCKPYFLLFLAMSSFYILKIFYNFVVSPVLGAWVDNKFETHVVPLVEKYCKFDMTSDDTRETWQDAKVRIDKEGAHHHLFSYKMAANTRYEDVIDAMNFSMDEQMKSCEAESNMISQLVTSFSKSFQLGFDNA